MKALSMFCLVAIITVFAPSPVVADLEQHYVPTLEWLVDTCDTIICVECRRGSQKLLDTIQGKDGAELVASPSRWKKRSTGPYTTTPWGRFGWPSLQPDGHRRLVRQLWFCRRLPKGEGWVRVAAISLPTWWSANVRIDPRNPFMYFTKPFLAINQYGDLFLTERRLREAITERMATAQPIVDPSDCETNSKLPFWPKPFKEKPGHWIMSPGDFPLTRNSVDFILLVPRSKEFRSYLLKELESPVAWQRQDAAAALVYYNDPKVLKALQKMLRDSYSVEKQEIDVSISRARLGRVYEVRKAAYQSLKTLRADVVKPTIVEWIDKLSEENAESSSVK